MMNDSSFKHVVALFIMISSSNAFAAATVWFEIQGDGGAPGNYLRLPNMDHFDIAMKATVTETPLYSVNTTLINNGPASLVFSDLEIFPPVGGAPVLPTAINSGPTLTANFGAGTFSGPGYFGDNITLATFRITSDSGNAFIATAQIGSLLWAQSDGQPASVRFADGPFVDGGTIGAGGTPVFGVPEPSTIGFLMIGLYVVPRRRDHGDG